MDAVAVVQDSNAAGDCNETAALATLRHSHKEPLTGELHA